MQSVVKLPVAIAILKLIDEGKISLDQAVVVGPDQYAPAWSPLRDSLQGGTRSVSVRELLERSVGESDNTAVDVLIALAGGAGRIQEIVNGLSIRGVRVDRTERELQAECEGIEKFRLEMALPAAYDAARAGVPEEKKRAAIERYLRDERDTATPKGMTHLLRELHGNKLISRSSTELLLKIMTESPTGAKRIKAGLPAGWRLAHKTGTGGDVLGINTATNDVGLAIGPAGECVAISIFVAGSKAPLEAREALMREIATAAVQPSAEEMPPSE
jgi:beta-lactamase class A